MTLSECCSATDRHFAAARAAKELQRYRRKGPTGTARRLLRLLDQAHARVESVLDVGGGIGVLQHELLAAGARTALQVEASSAYVAAASREAESTNQAPQTKKRACESESVRVRTVIPRGRAWPLRILKKSRQ